MEVKYMKIFMGASKVFSRKVSDKNIKGRKDEYCKEFFKCPYCGSGLNVTSDDVYILNCHNSRCAQINPSIEIRMLEIAYEQKEQI